MRKDCLVDMFKEAGGNRGKDGAFRFEALLGLTLFVCGGATMLTVDRVTRIVVKSEFVSIETDRGERFFVDHDRIVALRLHAASEGPGFLGR